MSETPLLILDEPGWCLSRPVARAFVETVVEIASEKKMAVAIISHQKGWWAGMIEDTLNLSPDSNSNQVLISLKKY
jgi:energy-coupling factor transporter ATP-binding protein EcfA2